MIGQEDKEWRRNWPTDEERSMSPVEILKSYMRTGRVMTLSGLELMLGKLSQQGPTSELVEEEHDELCGSFIIKDLGNNQGERYPCDCKAQHPNGGWIDVNDRIPEPNNEVLVALEDCPIPSTGQWTKVNKKGMMGWLLPGEVQENGAVTHWMPLPNAPTPPIR
jgi:hypothetical protein